VASLATIGVYGFDEAGFLAALRGADVALLLDVRQRRGVRGPQYAWANSRRLQSLLAQAEVAYRHEPTLAPTSELRHLQYREDDRLGVGKRSRSVLADAYRDGYTREILDRADLEAIVAAFPANGATVLLCVERDPQACHRGLAAARIAERFALPLSHLLPAEA
jgi:uncharacterized protein (DUF488 family)